MVRDYEEDFWQALKIFLGDVENFNVQAMIQFEGWEPPGVIRVQFYIKNTGMANP